MESFLEEVSMQFEGAIEMPKLLAMSERLQEQYGTSLKVNSYGMRPTYMTQLPFGNEKGTYLAVDVGGSTLRIALVNLQGRDSTDTPLNLTTIEGYTMDDSIKALNGDSFFDWMADKIKLALSSPAVILRPGSRLSMGLAWSYPIDQTSLKNGKVLGMAKGFEKMAQDLMGKDLADLIGQAFERKNLDINLDAIVNDSSATLLSRAYISSSTEFSLILGTGVNAAMLLPSKAFSSEKFGSRSQEWHDSTDVVLVNTELSIHGKDVFSTSRWDDTLNRLHPRPDLQPLEYLVGGRYLGEIVRLIMMDAVQNINLFDGQSPQSISEPYSLSTKTIAGIEGDDSNQLVEAKQIICDEITEDRWPISEEDIVFIRRVCQCVSRRAAAYLATALYALRGFYQSKDSSVSNNSVISVACNGSVIQKYPGLRSRCQSYLDMLGSKSNSKIELELAEDGTIVGAAVAAACAVAQRF